MATTYAFLGSTRTTLRTLQSTLLELFQRAWSTTLSPRMMGHHKTWDLSTWTLWVRQLFWVSIHQRMIALLEVSASSRSEKLKKREISDSQPWKRLKCNRLLKGNSLTRRWILLTPRMPRFSQSLRWNLRRWEGPAQGPAKRRPRRSSHLTSCRCFKAEWKSWETLLRSSTRVVDQRAL